MPKVFIIILNYNGKETLLECLQSVFQIDYPDREIVVVDNNSADGSLELAKKFYPRAHTIKNDKNIGFAAGNNVGIRFALEKMADYIFLLNNDAEIEKSAISKLVTLAQNNKEAGIISPIILKGKSNKVWFAGGKIKWLAMKTDHFAVPLAENPHKTDYISGCAMFVKKEVFKKIGLFDENFFLYYEDADFCWRARKERFESYVVPSAKVYHFERSEENKKAKIYWLVVSGIIFFKKNAPAFLKPWISFYLLLRKIKNWRDVNFKNDDIAKVVRKAYRDYSAIKK